MGDEKDQDGPSFELPDAEVIELANHRVGAEPMLRVLRASACFCVFMADEQTRTVICRRCGRTWDAFDAMLYISRKWTIYEANRNALRGEVENLRAKREEIRRDIQNLKAQKRRLGG